ncbi:MAG: radical SAM protein, partial [Cyanobacteriota bacterium]
GLVEKIKEFFTPPKPIESGFYHSRLDNPESDEYIRLHLRIGNDQEGTLIVNASKVVHLNKTATEMARYIIEGLGDDQIVKKLKSRYHVKEITLKSDLNKFFEFINDLANDKPNLENTGFQLSYVPPYNLKTKAPYRVDLALTYRCNNNCNHCYVERPREFNEISTDEWKKIIDILWNKTVPQITFTGGEATLREDLVDLINYAEDRGMVTGLITNGRRLADKEYLEILIKAGLDHVQITLESSNKDIHNKMTGSDSYDETVQAIKNCLEAGIPVITNTTITYDNLQSINDMIHFLRNLGLVTFACNAIIEAGGGKTFEKAIKIDDMVSAVDNIRILAEELDMNFIWYSPTKYCELNPIEIGVGLKQCSAGKHNLCIEPNGDVIPCQSYYYPLGNLLKDDWKFIWEHQILNSLRNYEYTSTECKKCDQLPICGGGCPLAGGQ